MNKKDFTKVLFVAVVGTMLVTMPSVGAVVGPSDTPIPTVTETMIPTPTPTQTKKRVYSTPTPKPTRDPKIYEEKLNEAKDKTLALIEDRLEPRLAEFEERVRNNENIEESAKGKLIARINTEQAWLNEQKAKIKNAEKILEVRDLAVATREHFEGFAEEMKLLHVRYVFVVVLENIVEKTEDNIIPRVSEALIKFSELGLDVSEAEILLQDVKDNVASAKISLSKIYSSTTYEEAKGNFDTAKDEMQGARTNLKSIIETLRNQADLLRQEQGMATPSMSEDPVL